MNCAGLGGRRRSCLPLGHDRHRSPVPRRRAHGDEPRGGPVDPRPAGLAPAQRHDRHGPRAAGDPHRLLPRRGAVGARDQGDLPRHPAAGRHVGGARRRRRLQDDAGRGQGDHPRPRQGRAHERDAQRVPAPGDEARCPTAAEARAGSPARTTPGRTTPTVRSPAFPARTPSATSTRTTTASCGCPARSAPASSSSASRPGTRPRHRRLARRRRCRTSRPSSSTSARTSRPRRCPDRTGRSRSTATSRATTSARCTPTPSRSPTTPTA